MTPTTTDTLTWYEAIPGQMPEDILKHEHYNVYGTERESTPYVLVCREHREMLDCAKRVRINELEEWAWYNGDGMTHITHWSPYTRPVPWDKKAHNEYMKKIRDAIFGKPKNK